MFKVLDKQRTKDLETQEHTVALGLVGELEAKQWPDPAGECKSCINSSHSDLRRMEKL